MASSPVENRPATEQPTRPPEESVWKRYSPHNEAPLSTVGSLALHALVIGLVVVFGLVMAMLGGNKNKLQPVEIVSIEGASGIPGAPGAAGGGSNTKPQKDPLLEEVDRKPYPEKKDPTDDNRPELTKSQIASLPVQLREDKDAEPWVKSGSKTLEIFLRVGIQVPHRNPPVANTGGNPGGKDGPRVGPAGNGGNGGNGGRAGKLTQQQQRMLRWTMLFDTSSGQNYVAQLNSLGAILGIPKTRQGGDYWLIRDLSRRPARLLNEDFTKLGRIQWTDGNPKSAIDIARTLQLNAVPTHFIAFMPEYLETKLAELEKAYRGLNEDQIFETKFMIRKTGSGYEPVVIAQTPK